MIRFFKIPLILFVLILLPKIAISSTSSSYLIANAAISSFDYETAVKYFDNDDYVDFSIRVLRKRIISYINSNKLEEAKIIANQVVELDENSEDVWLVLLTLARLNNDLNCPDLPELGTPRYVEFEYVHQRIPIFEKGSFQIHSEYS